MGIVIDLERYRHKGFPLYVDNEKKQVYGSKDVADDGEPVEAKIFRIKKAMEKINAMLVAEKERIRQNEEFPLK
jgi:hypothetical protein